MRRTFTDSFLDYELEHSIINENERLFLFCLEEKLIMFINNIGIS